MFRSQKTAEGTARSPRAALRTAVVVAFSALSIAGAATAASAAPQATTNNTVASHAVVPFSAQGCGGNACMYLSNPSGGYVYIDAWAYNTTFYGHMDLTRNGTVFRRTANRNWNAGGPAYRFTKVSAIVAQYCVVGWTSTGGFEGRACESIG